MYEMMGNEKGTYGSTYDAQSDVLRRVYTYMVHIKMIN